MDLEFPLSVKRTKSSAPPVKVKADPPSVAKPLAPRSWEVDEVHDEYLVKQAMSIIKDTGSQGLTKLALQASIATNKHLRG